ncbi:MAG: hypothetical protein ACPLKP_02975 [Microgenomates group bacterium]
MKKIIVDYLKVFFGYTLLTIFLFQIFPGKIFLYKGFFIYLTAIFIFVGLGLFFKKTNRERFFSALIVAFSLNFAFFILFPVTFERSVTMFLLNKIQNEEKKNSSCLGLTFEEAQKFLFEEYIKQKGAVEKRAEEQGKAGIIQFQNQCLSLTKKGKIFLSFSDLIKKLYHIK